MHTYQIWCDIESGSLGVQLEVQDPPHRWNIELEDGGRSQAAVHLCQGRSALVVLTCESEVARPDLLVQLIIQQIQGLYDAALIQCGISARVIGRAALLPDGRMASLNFHDVRSLIDPTASGLTLEELTRCAIESQVIRSCITDLRNATLAPQDSGMLCYRAVETMMQSYKTSEEEESREAWPRIRQALRFEKSYVDPLVAHSMANRHGRPMTITPEQLRDLATRVLSLLGRFARVNHLARPLTVEPVLT